MYNIIIIPCINNVASLELIYCMPSTSPDATHITIVLFSSGFPGIVRLEFRVALPYVIIPRLVIEESVEEFPFTTQVMTTPLLSTEHLYTAVCCIVIA